jgi:hypothetical protein
MTTVHSDFFKIVKEGCGEAFTEIPPVRPDVVFIDGQVNKAHESRCGGQLAVVLLNPVLQDHREVFRHGATDCGAGLRRLRARASVQGHDTGEAGDTEMNYEFAQNSCLPVKLPEDWGSSMANCTFKVKVVCKVLEVTKIWFENKLKQDPRYADLTLVLDYRGVPSVLQLPGLHPVKDFVEARDWSTSVRACHRQW